MADHQGEDLLVEIEALAAALAGEAGAMLRSRFRTHLEVEYKDKDKRDPVTSADKEVQAYLVEAISEKFPDHRVVGEEAPEEEEDSEEEGTAAADYLWVLDPLDGTTNFLNGLPIYGVSIGVLHRGTPVAGAVFVPWPSDHGGHVLHARKGGGAKLDGEPLVMPRSEGPEANRLSGLPGIFGARYRFRKPMRRKVGEVRLSGSIVYELALTALGAYQYVMLGGPRLWDVAAGVLVVMEAGGAVLVGQSRRVGWQPLSLLGPSWDSGPPTTKDVRSWAAPMVVGMADVAPFVAENIRDRSHLSSRVARLAKRLVSR